MCKNHLNSHSNIIFFQILLKYCLLGSKIENREITEGTSMRKTRGFTLIELVLVIAILGILAVAALPSLFNISLSQAQTNAMNATVASIQTGLSLYAANLVAQNQTATYPASLDSVSTYPGVATGLAPLFGGVLQTPISANWIKKSATCYVYDNNTSGTIDAGDIYFQYTGGSTGTFLQTTSASCT